jgi:hypothetical protein
MSKIRAPTYISKRTISSVFSRDDLLGPRDLNLAEPYGL